MRPRVLIALIFSTTAICVAPFMSPQPLEQLTMIVRDRQFNAALTKVDEIIEAGEATPEILMQAFRLHERYGDMQRAENALQTYLRLRPDDVTAWRRAASVYRNSHRMDSLVNALENIVALTSDADVVDRLLRIYRLHGRFEKELQLMRSRDLETLGEEHAIRFASLLVADGDLDGAANTLRHVDALAPPELVQPRMLLFDVLLEQSKFKKAAKLAERWLDRWRSAYHRSILVQYLLRAGADEPALQLATLPNAREEPEAMAYLVGMLAKEGRYDFLRRLLGLWVAQAEEMTDDRLDEHFRGIVNAAAEKGMADQILVQLHQILNQQDRPVVQASLIQAVFDRLGYGAIAFCRAAITPEMLAARPVFGARLLLAERNPLAARYFLLQADLRTLSADSRRQWLTIAEKILSSKKLLGELIRRAHAKELTPDLVRPTIDLAIRMGEQAQLRELWTALVENSVARRL